MPATASEPEFKVRLAHYRAITQEALLAYLPRKEPRRHLYDLVHDFLGRPGKGLRPALCLAACQALGGRAESALPSAAAIELLHNAFLVHDDIEDGSEFRRDRPTLQREQGLALAVNTGDAMQALAMRVLRANLPRLGPVLTWQIFEEVDHMLIESIEGQAMELGWIRDNACGVTEDDYLLMTLKKTCWYSFIHPLRIGVLVAGGPPATFEGCNALGFFMGAAFQIQDDILNLVGDARKYGKEIGGDLWEGKRTLMLAHVFRLCDAGERQKLQAFLAKPRTARLQREVDWVYDVLARYGSIDHARRAASDLAASAQEAFQKTFGTLPDGPDKAFIGACVDYLIARDL